MPLSRRNGKVDVPPTQLGNRARHVDTGAPSITHRRPNNAKAFFAFALGLSLLACGTDDDNRTETRTETRAYVFNGWIRGETLIERDQIGLSRGNGATDNETYTISTQAERDALESLAGAQPSLSDLFQYSYFLIRAPECFDRYVFADSSYNRGVVTIRVIHQKADPNGPACAAALNAPYHVFRAEKGERLVDTREVVFTADIRQETMIERNDVQVRGDSPRADTYAISTQAELDAFNQALPSQPLALSDLATHTFFLVRGFDCPDRYALAGGSYSGGVLTVQLDHYTNDNAACPAVVLPGFRYYVLSAQKP